MGATGAILTSALLDALDACQGRYGLVVTTGAMGVSRGQDARRRLASAEIDVHGEPVVLRRHRHLARGEVLHRVVGAPVAEL